jgi:hypothetical protein
MTIDLTGNGSDNQLAARVLSDPGIQCMNEVLQSMSPWLPFSPVVSLVRRAATCSTARWAVRL